MILVIGAMDIVAGWLLCCHPDRKFISNRRQLLGLNDSEAEPEEEGDDEKMAQAAVAKMEGDNKLI